MGIGPPIVFEKHARRNCQAGLAGLAWLGLAGCCGTVSVVYPVIWLRHAMPCPCPALPSSVVSSRQCVREAGGVTGDRICGDVTRPPCVEGSTWSNLDVELVFPVTGPAGADWPEGQSLPRRASYSAGRVQAVVSG